MYVSTKKQKGVTWLYIEIKTLPKIGLKDTDNNQYQEDLPKVVTKLLVVLWDSELATVPMAGDAMVYSTPTWGFITSPEIVVVVVTKWAL